MRKRPTGPSSGVLIKAALDYGRLGWSVVPVEPRDKRSPIRWQIYQRRRPETTEIGDWFTRWPTANLAIVTGVVSALVVLDLDPRQDGEASRARLEREHGPLPETVEARTGGGGRHLYFRHPGEMVQDRVGLAPGIDLRGDGGYVVAPPSVHASGESYRWTRSPEVFHLEPLPAWLSSASPIAQKGSPNPLEQWPRLTQDGVAEGDRSDAVASLARHLLGNGIEPKVVLELMLCWSRVRCRPPLEIEAIAHTVERIAHRHGEGTDRGT
jgi:hypothetical protein